MDLKPAKLQLCARSACQRKPRKGAATGKGTGCGPRRIHPPPPAGASWPQCVVQGQSFVSRPPAHGRETAEYRESGLCEFRFHGRWARGAHGSVVGSWQRQHLSSHITHTVHCTSTHVNVNLSIKYMYLHGTPSCTEDDAAPNRCEVSLPREVSRVAASFLEAGWRRFPPGAVILLPLLVLLGSLGPYFCRPVKAP